MSAALEISDNLGGFTGPLDPVDSFGYALAALGDVDGDGTPDMAVGADLDDDGGGWYGAVWILFMNPDGTVRDQQKISALSGGFTGTLDFNDRFGSCVADLGDMDGDGVLDIAVGANYDDDGASDTGALWVLFLNADGTVKSHQKISGASGGMAGLLAPGGRFGRSVTSLGDMDGDGVTDIAAGAWKDDDGAVWVLMLNADGTVKNATRIAEGMGGFGGDVSFNFGIATAAIGDVDADGVVDLAIGANGADFFRGEVWIAFMNANGTVKAEQRVAWQDGGFEGALEVDDLFGTALGRVPDRDGNGVDELLVGAVLTDDGGSNHGAAWVLFLESDGTVHGHQKISETAGSLGVTLSQDAFFGSAVSAVDFDQDGRPELAIGSSDDNDFLPIPQTGSVFVLTLNEALWIDLGLGLAGAHGEPRLVGEGTLAVGAPIRLALSGTLENATAFLVVGGGLLEAPFKSGVLVPTVDFVTPATLTGALGAIDILTTWPPGAPSGTTFAYQWWVMDPAGAVGWAASNGVTGTTP